MNAAPLILISPSTQRQGTEFFDYSFSLSEAYPQAVIRAGGIPWVAGCTADARVLAESVRRCHGVLLTGGDDVQPALYRARLPARLKKTLSPADPQRDLAELLLIREVFRQRRPLLAICRGQQILNVAFGGTLYVDLALQKPRALRHSRTDLKDRIVHEVAIEPDSLLFEIFGRRCLGVNSSHHQAVERLANPFRIAALSPDGVVEALELTRANRHLLPYFLAVQFHPERLIERHGEFVDLFRSFIEACASESKRSL